MLQGINPAGIVGEPGTGYEDPDGKGEFSCRNCKAFVEADSSCKNPDMRARSKRKKLENGNVEVKPLGCCEYVHRKGRYGGNLAERSKKYGR